jgi:hypothetical protein
MSIRDLVIQEKLNNEQLLLLFNQDNSFSVIIGNAIFVVFLLALGFGFKDKNEKIAYFLAALLTAWGFVEWSPSSWYKIGSTISLFINLLVVINLAIAIHKIARDQSSI